MESGELAGAPKRPKRTRVRRDGCLMLPKNAASAKNARPRRITLQHGGSTGGLLRTGMLDRRSRLGKLELTQIRELTAMLGGDVTPALAALVTHRARVHILTLVAWAELSSRNLFNASGEPVPALDAFLRLVHEDRELLKLIGLRRKPKDVPELGDYLKRKEHGDD